MNVNCHTYKGGYDPLPQLKLCPGCHWYNGGLFVTKKTFKRNLLFQVKSKNDESLWGRHFLNEQNQCIKNITALGCFFQMCGWPRALGCKNGVTRPWVRRSMAYPRLTSRLPRCLVVQLGATASRQNSCWLLSAWLPVAQEVRTDFRSAPLYLRRTARYPGKTQDILTWNFFFYIFVSHVMLLAP